MRWHRFTKRMPAIGAVVGLLIIGGNYLYACATGQAYGVQTERQALADRLRLR